MADWEKYSEHQQFPSEDLPELLAKHLRRTDWLSFLDLGCGDGSLIYAASKRGYFKGKDVYALDISQKRIERVRRIDPDIRCFVDNACAIEHVAPGSIDLVASSQVIEHVQDDSAMLREIAKVTKKNGIAYISTVFKKKGALYIYRNNGQWVIDPTHVREYTDERQLVNRIGEAGFEVIEHAKTPLTRPLVGFTILSKIGAGEESLVRSSVLRFLHRVRIPIPGYYLWELVLRKV